MRLIGLIQLTTGRIGTESYRQLTHSTAPQCAQCEPALSRNGIVSLTGDVIAAVVTAGAHRRIA